MQQSSLICVAVVVRCVTCVWKNWPQTELNYSDETVVLQMIIISAHLAFIGAFVVNNKLAARLPVYITWRDRSRKNNDLHGVVM